MIINGVPVLRKSTINDYRIIYYEANGAEPEEMFQEGEEFAEFLLDKCPKEFYNGIIATLTGVNDES